MAEGGMDLGLTIHGGSSYDENLQNTCKNCKHLDQFLAAAREYINKLEGDIECLREELSTYSKKNPDLHYERIDSERAKRRLQEKNTELESLLDNAKQESRKRKEDYQQAAAKVRYLEKIMQTHGPKSDHGKALQNENEQLKASLKTVKDSHAETEEQIRNLLKENAVITDKNRENEQIKGKLEYCNKTLKVHLEKENTRAEELIKEHLKLKNEWKIILEGKEGEIDEINEKLNAKESNILVLNKSLDGKEERLKELQGMNSYLKETKEDLERELDSKCVALKKCEETYERDNRGFQTEAQKFRADISSLKKELHCEKINNKSHKSELERQNSLLDAKNAEIDSLTGKLQTEKKLVSEKNEALNNEKQSLDDAKKQLKDLEGKMQHLQTLLNHSNEENAAQASKSSKIEDQNRNLQREITKIKSDIKIKDKEINDKSCQIKQLNDAIDKRNAALHRSKLESSEQLEEINQLKLHINELKNRNKKTLCQFSFCRLFTCILTALLIFGCIAGFKFRGN